jgi:CheY-like chemotaxis protein
MTSPAKCTNGARSRVLVVEDSSVVLSAIADFLKNAGYVVMTARNGAEALEYLEATHPAVILLDQFMPVMDGKELLMVLRQRPGATIPVILMTAGEQGAKAARELGADGSLRKPFQPEELLRVIEQVCAGTAAGEKAPPAVSPDGSTPAL